MDSLTRIVFAIRAGRVGRHSAYFDASEGTRLRQEFARRVLCKRQRAFRGAKFFELTFALLGRTRMPVGVGEMSSAEPLGAPLAILLRALVAGLIHARNSLTKLWFGFCGCCVHRILRETKTARGQGIQRAGSTTPTLFTPLQAIYTRPSAVATMWRTVPPPEGIAARANCSVLGLNWMSVFGFTPDSLYQTSPSGVMAIP